MRQHPLELTRLHPCLRDPVLDTMNFLNEVTAQFPAATSFAPGRPLEKHFRSERILRDALATAGSSLDAKMQYGPAKGIAAAAIAKMLANDEAIRVEPEDVVVTVGAQEAMFLAVLALRDERGESVLLVQEPCYVGILGVARMVGMPIEPVASGPDGLSLEALEEAVRRVEAAGKRAAAVYVCPDFSNPEGTTMPLAERRALLRFAAEHELLVVEDNAYGMFSFDGERLPTLKSLDDEGVVVYLGTFSKLIFPGIRVGFVAAGQRITDGTGASRRLADELGKLKSMLTVNTPPASQLAVLSVLERCDHSLAAFERDAITSYRESRDALLSALEKHFPDAGALGVSWNRPSGGFFLTVEVPFDATDALLQRSAGVHGVIWVPMRYFYVRDRGRRQIRLAFSYVPQEQIDEGIARFARFVREAAEAARG
jgi:(S)-3,5-dihydroxyphenylglycine transaminase